MTPRFRRFDWIAIAALGLYALSVVPFMPAEGSNIADTLLSFVLAGFAASRALFPGQVSGFVRFTTIIAFTLGLGIVGGFVINLLPTGFTQTNWATYALMTTLVSYVVARCRGAREILDLRRPRGTELSGVAWSQIVASALILAVAVVITVTSRSWTETPFTELWLVPDNATRTTSDASGAVVGIKSHELATEAFTVVVDTGKRTMRSEVTLEPQQVWTQTVPIEGLKATASIYRSGATDPQPYRTVFLVAQ